MGDEHVVQSDSHPHMRAVQQRVQFRLQFRFVVPTAPKSKSIALPRRRRVKVLPRPDQLLRMHCTQRTKSISGPTPNAYSSYEILA